MNVAIEPNEWMPAMPGNVAGEAFAHPEWHVLRARLSAGLGSWRVVAQIRREAGMTAFGSFSHRAARSLDRINASCTDVNQASSVNCKRHGGMLPDVVGVSITGGRGQR
jgi:hypothetical protein